MVLGIGATAHGVSQPRNPGLLVWSAFECSTFAELAGDKNEQRRLFDLGHRTGVAFLTAVASGTAKEEERAQAPVGLLMRLGGPNPDFMLGRIFEGANEDSFDQVVKTNNEGVAVDDPRRWLEGDARVQKAKSEFSKANCALLR